MSNHSPQSLPSSSNIDEKKLLQSYAMQFGASLIRNFQRRGAQQATAEDLAQEVFLRLARRVSGGEIESPQAYLMQTASNVWYDHLKQRQRQSHKQHVEYDEKFEKSSEAFSPKRVLEVTEQINSVIELLESLPERTQSVYVLCKVEGFKRKEVAERLSISISAVDKHLITATKLIGDAFGLKQ